MTFLLPRTIPVLQTVCDLHEILRSFKYAGVILCTRRLNLIANLSYSKRTSGRKPLTMSECIRDSPFQPTSACLRSRYQHARRGRDRPSAGRKKKQNGGGGGGGGSKGDIKEAMSAGQGSMSLLLPTPEFYSEGRLGVGH